MEIGIGIHGEPGRFREPLGPASQVVERLATAVVEDLPYESGDQVLAFVNGMGGTPLIELYIVYNELNKFLSERGITIARNLIGDYITSLEMAGCSITLLKLDDELDAAVGRAREHARAAVGRVTAEQVRDWLRRYAEVIAEHRMELVRLDTAIGDGDHGTNMDRGMRKAIEKLDGSAGGDIGADLKAVGMALVSSVGGAAGPLYGTLFLQMGSAAAGKDELDLDGWTAAVEAGLKGVQARGKAEPGDKTMVDALAAGARGAARGRRARRGAAAVGRRGRGGHEGDDPARGAQGAGELSRPAQRRPPGPGSDVDVPAAALRRRALDLAISRGP